jgi:hypothetical protein
MIMMIYIEISKDLVLVDIDIYRLHLRTRNSLTHVIFLMCS